MAIDSMNKVIHAAVRRDFGRLDRALAAAGDGDRARAADLYRAWQHLARQLRHHHQQEDRLLWPCLASLGVAADLLAEMEAEHEAMASALDEIDSAMATYAASGSTADAATAVAAVRAGLVVVERHFVHEEGEIEPALAPHLGSPEWKAVEKQFRKEPPKVAGWFFAWVQDGMTDEARTFLGSTVPAPVRMILSKVFGRGYHREIAPVWA